MFGVSASTAIQPVVDQRDRGAIAQKRQGRAPGAAGKLAPHRAFPVEIVRAEPGIALKELVRGH